MFELSEKTKMFLKTIDSKYKYVEKIRQAKGNLFYEELVFRQQAKPKFGIVEVCDGYHFNINKNLFNVNFDQLSFNRLYRICDLLGEENSCEGPIVLGENTKSYLKLLNANGHDAIVRTDNIGNFIVKNKNGDVFKFYSSFNFFQIDLSQLNIGEEYKIKDLLEEEEEE